MDASFDKAAVNYDKTFTNTEIGKMQRALVYTELSKHLTSVQNILEINCGTGEDAIWFAKQNFKITATDISPKMIEIAKSKANLNFKTADINSIATTFEGENFDRNMIVRGSLERLSPVLMTALVTAFALAPLLFEAERPGTEILHPVAVVIFGGLISSTLLDTYLTPALFWLYGEKDAKALNLNSDPHSNAL